MTDETTGAGTGGVNNAGLPQHPEPSGAASPDVPRARPVAKPDFKLRNDVAKILGTVKLPERKEAGAPTDSQKIVPPRSSAPIGATGPTPSKNETPMSDFQKAARAALPAEWQEKMGPSTKIISADMGPALAMPKPPATITQTPKAPGTAMLKPEVAAPTNGAVPNVSTMETALSPAKAEGSPLVRSLRTLKDDLQELVRTRKMSLIRAVALEGEKKVRATDTSVAEEAVARSRRNRTVKFFSILVVCFGVGALALLTVAYVQTARTTPRAASYDSSLMFAEQTLAFPLGNLTGRDIKAQLAQTRTRVNLTLGAIARIVPTLAETDPATGENRERPAFAREFLSAIAPAAPEDLLRSLGNEFFFGIHSIDENAPLIVLPLASYQNAFAAMIAWEPTMNEDLAPLFPRVYHETIDAAGAPVLARFEDVIIRNYDVRALKDARGEIQMLYAFPTRNILIIAESSHSFVEALARLRAERRI